jgi:transcriptional regulator of acetoin/glycerol metabolism
MKRLLEYSYPGNVRELENVLEHAFILCRGTEIRLSHLPDNLSGSPEPPPVRGSPLTPQRLPDLEREMIREVLERSDWNRDQAARELGMHRSTLWRKVQRYGLRPL